MDGQVAIRYPRGGQGAYIESIHKDEYILREGTDISIAAYGTMINQAVAAADKLSELGISAEVIKIGCVKPNGFEITLSSISRTGKFIFAEDVCDSGCVGRQILSLCAEKGIEIKSCGLINLGEGLVPHGSVGELMRDCGLDADGIALCARKLCEK